MLKALKNLAQGRDSGALTGKTVTVGHRVVKLEKLLGEGGFATIYRCSDVDTGEVFALKHFVLTGYPEAARDVDTEVAVMEQLAGCPYIVRLHDAAVAGPPTAPTAAFVLMDFCPDTLVAFLQQRAYQVEDATLLRIAMPICRAVEAMHGLQQPLAHRDLKAENVLLGPNGNWVLCDFGSASARHGVLESARDIALEEEVVRRYTTPAYRAPELYDLFAREYIGPPVDIWALGVLLYLLSYGKLPFEGEAKLQVLNGKITVPEGRPPLLRALIKDMLNVSPKERPTIQQVIARLSETVPSELSQPMATLQQQKEQQTEPVSVGRPAGIAASTAAPRQHERVPSQGWADFADSTPPPPAASLGSTDTTNAVRRRTGSIGSWATFSPKKGEPASAASAAGVAAGSIGSFWSSFGEDMPDAAAQLQGQASQREAQPPVQPDRQMQRYPVPSVQQPAPTAACVAESLLPQTAGVALPQSQAAAEPMETSPLSAGLAHMTLDPSPNVSSAGSASVAPPPHAHAEASSMLSIAEGAAQPRQVAEPAAMPSSAIEDPLGELEALRQHCAVLERLLDARNAEVHRLHRQVQQQSEEINKLHQQGQQAEKAMQEPKEQQAIGCATADFSTSPASASAASAAPGAVIGSTPGSSTAGKDIRLQVLDDGLASGSACRASGGWVAFNPGGGSGDAPTPTLLQSVSGSFKDSSRQPAIGVIASQAAASVAMAGLEDASDAKLTHASLENGGSHSLNKAASEQLRSSSSTSMAMPRGNDQQQAPQLRSFPVNVNPCASPQPDGPRAAPASAAAASAKPSPVRTGIIGVSGVAATNGTASPMQPGSPMHPHPSSGLSMRGSGSPSKHRRNVTAPNTFFADLDPLH